MAALPAIHLTGVRKAFKTATSDPLVALDDINLTIGHHQFVAVIGPSGCGKSTILRLIAGLMAPTSGRIEIDGRPVDGPRDEIGIVFQRPTLLPWLNVLSNVTFPVRHKFGKVGEGDREQARQLLALVGLAEFERSLPDALSGGMQQRVAIARSLLHDPQILLMDEPFSALDALTRDEMSFELLGILHKRPKTVVFVTHSIPEAVLLSDRIVVMSPRPARVREVIDVPLARPRSLETFSDPVFNGLANDIRKQVFTRPLVV